MTETVLYLLEDGNWLPSLRTILGKGIDRKWRMAVRCPSDQIARELDDNLWKRPKDGFLPHARSGGEFDDEQPILIVTQDKPVNGPHTMIHCGIMKAHIHEAGEFERFCLMVDGSAKANIDSAMLIRQQLAESGLDPAIWERREGKWKQRPDPDDA